MRIKRAQVFLANLGQPVMTARIGLPTPIDRVELAIEPSPLSVEWVSRAPQPFAADCRLSR
jgi:hypothetical protein